MTRGGRLEYLAQAYFHQDYALDAATPLDLVREYLREETADSREQLAKEIRDALTTFDEEGLRDLWLESFRASYEPDLDGMTYRQWFEQVLEVLRGSI